MNNGKCVLNLGAGSIDPYRFVNDRFSLHVDGCYRDGVSVDANEAEILFSESLIGSTIQPPILCKSDIFEFVERFPFKFDKIYAERIFEHMEYVGGDIGRLLEGINRISKPDAVLEIVVPNIILVSKMLLNYEKNADSMSITDQLNTKLIVNTEMQNIRADPHVSTWTPRLATEYIESEGTWVVDSMEEQIKFAGRNIYMRVICSKS